MCARRSPNLSPAPDPHQRHATHPQAPQWLVDAQAVEWLLLPVMHVAPPGGGPAGDAGALVLAPLAALSEAYEADGSRLSPTLLLSLSQHVADFSSARDL